MLDTIQKFRTTLWRIDVKPPEFLGWCLVPSLQWGQDGHGHINVSTTSLSAMRNLDNLPDGCVLEMHAQSCGEYDQYQHGIMLASISDCSIVSKTFPDLISGIPDTDTDMVTLEMTAKGLITRNWDAILAYFAGP